MLVSKITQQQGRDTLHHLGGNEAGLCHGKQKRQRYFNSWCQRHSKEPKGRAHSQLPVDLQRDLIEQRSFNTLPSFNTTAPPPPLPPTQDGDTDGPGRGPLGRDVPQLREQKRSPFSARPGQSNDPHGTQLECLQLASGATLRVNECCCDAI
ncbi:hypothetical protein AAFF_G00264710 [Aldrovandia affinis]|uniref:Uncharacterized protein n=1 Tax=Aldrovandia affinis TaxID=143900 RepID=A0AAD7W2R1_9TELE|nr:hypothetical protein AAFF_G00264710 [Aldrovandia affinis]